MIVLEEAIKARLLSFLKFLFMTSIYLETYGCASNKFESSVIAGLLERAGFNVVSSPSNADVAIINTCCVKLKTRNKMIARIRKLAEIFGEERVIIAGCMPEVELETLIELFPLASYVSTNHLAKFPKAVLSVLKGEQVVFVGKNKEEKVNLPRKRMSEVIEIIQICQGCNNACSFCVVKLAKGEIFSYETEKIVREIERAKKLGAREFWITGQDVASYGLDIADKSLLPELLEEILANVRGKYRIRLGMMNPSNVFAISPKLLRLLKDEHLFKFLHLPVQSGSDKILKRMNRKYSVADFADLVRKFRRHFPLMSIWTDVIVAFPGESEADFNKSVELIRKLEFDYVNVSRFSPHPVLKLSKEKQVATNIAKERSKKLTKLVREIALKRNELWVGSECEILVDEFNKKKGNYIGRNESYKPVVLKESPAKLGEFREVRITDASFTSLFA